MLQLLTKHTDAVMASCTCTLYGLRTLQALGMSHKSLQIVRQSTALSKILTTLLGKDLQMLVREIDWRLFSNELSNLVITPDILYQLWTPSENRLINNYSLQSITTPFTPFIDAYHQSAVHHTSPVPVYTCMSSSQNYWYLQI